MGQHEAHRRHVGHPCRAIFLEALAEERTNITWHVTGHRGPVGFTTQHRRQRVGHIVSAERALPRQHFVEHAAIRPDVAAFIGCSSPRLLRTHVRSRPEDHPDRCRHPRRRDRAIDGRAVLSVGHPGETEVEHLDGAIVCQGDIRRFQIAVNDALLVRRFESVCDLPGNGEGVING
jgi:hypothetical protein